MHFGVDDNLKDSGMQEQGELTADYELKEEEKPKLCGVFKGTMPNEKYKKFGWEGFGH